jgi:hypothetical protein
MFLHGWYSAGLCVEVSGIVVGLSWVIVEKQGRQMALRFRSPFWGILLAGKPSCLTANNADTSW